MSKREGNHIYKIIANGNFVSEKNVESALAALGLKVIEQETSYSLHHALQTLPEFYFNFADKCSEYLRRGELPDSWAGYEVDIEPLTYSLSNDVDANSVPDVAEVILNKLLAEKDYFEAEHMVCDLLAVVLV